MSKPNKYLYCYCCCSHNSSFFKIGDLWECKACLSCFACSGSQTLHHWQQLAQPNLGTILDPRPGVITKGFTQVPKDVVYHISDLEEDEEEGITFQVQQPLQLEQKPALPTPVTGIFLPPMTSAGGPGTGERRCSWTWPRRNQDTTLSGWGFLATAAQSQWRLFVSGDKRIQTHSPADISDSSLSPTSLQKWVRQSQRSGESVVCKPFGLRVLDAIEKSLRISGLSI